MKTSFVGIDISKEWLDVCVCVQDGSQARQLLAFREDNTISGIESLIDRCKKVADRTKLWCCFEHTGYYGLLLAQLLENNNIVYSAVPGLEIKQSGGMRRGKSDKIDALRIAEYAILHHLKLQPTQLPGGQLLAVKNLLTYRAQLVKTSQQYQNSRKSYLLAAQATDLQYIINDLDRKIQSLTQDIAATEMQIKNIIVENKELYKTFQQIITVKGIGLIIAATMIVCTNNFSAFDSARKFNAYAGIAPFEYTSGSSIRGATKTSKLRNRTMKKLLFNGASSALVHDPELKNYYKRKKDQGKNHMTILNAVACKLVYRVFAVVKREQPFVNLMR